MKETLISKAELRLSCCCCAAAAASLHFKVDLCAASSYCCRLLPFVVVVAVGTFDFQRKSLPIKQKQMKKKQSDHQRCCTQNDLGQYLCPIMIMASLLWPCQSGANEPILCHLIYVCAMLIRHYCHGLQHVAAAVTVQAKGGNMQIATIKNKNISAKKYNTIDKKEPKYQQ